MGIFGLLFITVLVGPAVVRDFRHRCHDFFFTTPVGKLRYLAGRFLGAFTGSFTVYLALALGYLAGCATLPGDRLGPGSPADWLAPVSFFLLPNLALVAILFFSFATLTRKMITTYVLGIGLMVAYAITQQVTPGESILAGLLDPFGLIAFDSATDLWTQAERNSQGFPLAPLLIANRLLWGTVTVLIGVLTVTRFRFVSQLEGRKRAFRSAREAGTGSKEVHTLARPSYPDEAATLPRRLSALLRLALLEVRRVALHPGFLIVAAIGLTQLLSNLTDNLGANRSFVHPLTSFILSLAPRHISFYTLAFTLFFAGVIVWRERDHRCHSFFDVQPLPNWVFFGAKLLAVLALQTLYMGAAVLCCLAVQVLVHGYWNVEPALYLQGFFGIELPTLWLFGIAAVVVQVLSPNKYWGFAFTAGIFVQDGILTNLGIGDNLLRFAGHPGYIYSDMNGFGHYLSPLLWFQGYWFSFCALLALLAVSYWPRGLGRVLRLNRGTRLLAIPAGSFLLASGLWIYYNNHTLNAYRSSHDVNLLRANYERAYGSFEGAPRPTLRHVALEVDLFPRERDVWLRGRYELRNQTQVEISQTLLSLFPFRQARLLKLEASDGLRVEVTTDSRHGVHRLTFSPPLGPGEGIRLTFEVEVATRGFAATNQNNEIVGNGSYVDGLRSGWYLPMMGYEGRMELTGDELRASFGLPPERTLPEPGAPEGRLEAGQGGDLVTFEIRVETDADQIPLGPGNLLDEGMEGSRRWARFASQTPVSFGALCFFSGRYEMKEAEHSGVRIQIYYHPGHEYNLQSMIRGARRSLTYNSANYGPYPFRYLRIIEVPDLGTIRGTARALPGVFAWTETGGFVSNLEVSGVLDVVFNTTTHETAHQWWGHQLTPGRAKGGGVLVETLSQWVRIETLRQEYGEEVAEEFRRNEMRLYLRSRGAGDEAALGTSDNASVLYRKGTVAMSALGAYLGEDVVNGALRSLLQKFSGSDRFPTTADLVRELRDRAPEPEQQRLITDIFERIILFDNKIVSIETVRESGSNFRVRFEAGVRKLEASASGAELPTDLNDWIEIAALDASGATIHREMVLFRQALHQVEWSLDREPAWIEIDPRALLIDRNQNDNRMGVPTVHP